MARCPACDARLNGSSLCRRCGADLNRLIRCERLARQWLSVALQCLHAGRADVAVLAIARSLSFQQIPLAKQVKRFLVYHQYQALYESLEQRRWQDSAKIIYRLKVLQGRNETLRRFEDFVGYVSDKEQ